jgi:hypothetical protein
MRVRVSVPAFYLVNEYSEAVLWKNLSKSHIYTIFTVSS